MNRDEASGEDTDLMFTSGWGDAHHFHCPLQSAGAIVDLVEKKASMLQSVQTLLDSTCVATLNH